MHSVSLFGFASVGASDNPRSFPPALVVAEGALNVNYHAEVTSRIEHEGWKATTHDPAGNELYNSHKWTSRQEGPIAVKQWM